MNFVMSLAATGPYAFMRDETPGVMLLINPVNKDIQKLAIPHFGFVGDRERCIKEANDRINTFFDVYEQEMRESNVDSHGDVISSLPAATDSPTKQVPNLSE